MFVSYAQSGQKGQKDPRNLKNKIIRIFYGNCENKTIVNTKMILSENSNYLMKCRSVFGVKIQSKKVEQLENEKISQSGFVYLKKSQMKILKILINPDFYKKKPQKKYTYAVG